MSKKISEMIREIIESRCENMDIEEFKRFYIDAKIEQFEEEEWDTVDIIDMYIEEVDEDYVHN